MKTLRKKRYALCAVIIPLVLGAGIYIAVCPDVWFVSKINRVLGIQQVSPDDLHPVAAFVRNYLCDLLWAYALTGTLLLISGEMMCVWSPVIAVLLGIVLELLQRTGIITGTADVFDIVAEAAGAAAATMVYIYGRKQHENK